MAGEKIKWTFLLTKTVEYYSECEVEAEDLDTAYDLAIEHAEKKTRWDRYQGDVSYDAEKK